MLLLALIGIIVRVERRMGKALTREEHERICKDRNDRVEKQIDDMRGEMRETFDKIDTGITGTHRRLDDLYRDLINRSGR